MKNLLILFLLIAGLAKSQTIKGDEIQGTWLTGNTKAKIYIYKKDNKFYGKFVWFKDPNYEDGTPKLDKKNPDVSKRSAPLMGMNMLNGFVFSKDKWENGTIYNPEDGKTYSCKIAYRDGKLDVRGFVGISLLGKTDTWFKTADIK